MRLYDCTSWLCMYSHVNCSPSLKLSFLPHWRGWEQKAWGWGYWLYVCTHDSPYITGLKITDFVLT